MSVCTLDESGFRNADVGSLEEGVRAWLQARRHPGAGCGQFGQHLGPRRVEGVLHFLENRMSWAVPKVYGPGQWHYLASAEALYAV